MRDDEPHELHKIDHEDYRCAHGKYDHMDVYEAFQRFSISFSETGTNPRVTSMQEGLQAVKEGRAQRYI
jgi:hypothetical protein